MRYEADVADFGLVPERPELDCAPLLDRMHEEAAEGVVRKFVWGPGAYYFHTQPKPINVRGISHIGVGRPALGKAFISTTPYGGIFNLDWGATGFNLIGFGMASTAASQETGSLISMVPLPPAGQALSEVNIEDCYLTSEARPESGHRYGIYVDGSLAGQAKTPMVRGIYITRTRVFGTVRGGYAMLFHCCGGVEVTGGGWTPGWMIGNTAPDAVVRFDGPNMPDTSLNAQNSIVRPGACYDIQFANANNIIVDATWIYRIARTPRTSHVKVSGPIYLGSKDGLIGDWSGKDGCRWSA